LKYLSDGTDGDLFGVRTKKLQSFEAAKVGFAGKAKNEDFGANSRSNLLKQLRDIETNLNTLI